MWLETDGSGMRAARLREAVTLLHRRLIVCSCIQRTLAECCDVARQKTDRLIMHPTDAGRADSAESAVTALLEQGRMDAIGDASR